MGLRRALQTPWLDLVRGLGQAYLELLAAEWAEVKRQLALSGKRLLWGAAFFGAAAAVGFWLVALVLFLLVAVLHVWLPWWAAALIVTAVALLVIAVLGWLGLRRIQQVENPAAVVTGRYEDHLDWWERRLLAEERRVAPAGTESRGELS